MLPIQQTTNLFIGIFREYAPVSHEIISEIASRTKTVSRKKGSYVVKEGQIATGLYIVEKGLVRGFYNRQDQEVTMWFGYEGIIFASIASFYNNKRSREVIQCLEDSVFQFISNGDLQALYQKYPQMNTISRKITEEYCIILDNRIFSMQTLSAEQRYRELLENEPEIIKRVALGYIASYLGISQETLSRIRKKLIF